jgi:DNA-binding NtrC family response regulator
VPSPTDRVIEAFIGNPFATAPADREAAARALADLDPAAELSQLLGAGDVELAKTLVLAVGHAQACRDPDDPAKVLDEATLPPALARKLPRQPAAYRRLAMAAGRAHRGLAAVRGASDRLRRARHDTWAACFGDSLRHALELESVIRDHDVLILGETGTGKEAFARAIQHATPGPADGSPAARAAINAAAIPETLVESELFGHVKGAYTGATETRSGRIRSADGGAFFLDEVGDLPQTTQVKLLRVIETDEVFPVGSDTPERVDVRYVAATHKDLEKMVDEGGFRRDLFERLAGNVIRIPPLRDRPEDLHEIGVSFVRQYLGDRPPSDEILSFLDSAEARSYAWPGNVRELQNALRNLMLGLPPGLGHEPGDDSDAGGEDSSVPDPIRSRTATMQTVEAWYLRAVVDSVGGNLTQAARVLGLDRSTVRRRLRG